MTNENYSKNLRRFTYIVIGYMLLAFTWWSVLLFIKNRDAFQAKVELMRIGQVAERIYKDDATFKQHSSYLNLKKKYDRQEYMILGEALFFVFSLIFGIWMINRGYKHQVAAAEQSRNFLLSITHELKSPLSSIQLVLETFRKRELNKEQTLKLSNNALKETERLNMLVSDLLLAARVETAYQPNLQEVDLVELIHDLIFSMKEKNPNAMISLYHKTEIPKLNLDKQGIISVLLNLIENAIKYSEESAVIDISIEAQNQQILIDVADNGIGIPESEKKHIFNRFYRVGNENTRKTKGTGLGLYIVYQIIKAHKGKISIANNTPKGTIFKVNLPC